MSELNNLIGTINQTIYPYRMDDFSGGVNLGLQAGAEIGDGWTLVGSYERLSGESKVSDSSALIRIAVPANVFKGGFEYVLPSAESFRYAVGVQAGVVSTSGGADLNITGEGALSTEYEGSAAVFETYVAGIYWTPTRSFSISPQIGYRYANISDPTANGNTLLFALNYSGLVARVAARVAIAK